jgi:hypothetical protein
MPQLDSHFHVTVIGEPMRLYRASHGDAPVALERALSSNFAAGRSPHPQDRRAAVLYMAVSMFESRDAVLRLARSRPSRIGTHLLEVDLRPGLGPCAARTGASGHWSIWGVPTQLLACVTDVVPV